MRIVHVVDDLTPANTGITTAVRELSRAGIAAGWPVEVVSVGARADWGVSGLQPQAAPIRGVGLAAAWRYAPQFEAMFRRAIADGALVHIHGMWFYPQWCAARLALRHGWPIIASPHNMLGGWLWRRGQMRRLKKAVYFNAFMKWPLCRAAVIHAVSDDESARIGEFLPGSKRMTVPHALDLVAVDREIAAGGQPARDQGRYVLFLGRIHPVKGLEALIEAVARAHDVRVIIAGPPEDVRHYRSLQERVLALGLVDRVRFVGTVQGPEKWRLLKGAWALCLPSHSEVLGMAVLEAMAAGVPVITTPGAGFAEMDSAGGILVEVDPGQIAAALLDAVRWSDSERAKRGALARTIAEQKYSWPRIWPLYEELYRSAAASNSRYQ